MAVKRGAIGTGLLALCLGVGGWSMAAESAGGMSKFGDDLQFLKSHVETVVIGEGDAQVAIVPAYQGRVMTSTAQGADGVSLGWINRALIASGETVPHMNPFGGEDRFWIGPEGGQYGVFFAPGSEFTTDTWQTPAPIDTEAYKLLKKTDNSALFGHDFEVTNWSGTKFKLGVEREIRLLDQAAVADALGTAVPEGVAGVAYESRNRLTNRGSAPWEKETGLLSIWILGMYPPAPHATVVIPFKEGPESELGPKVNDSYFGKVPTERLVVRDDILFFKADGQQRGKIGISPKRSKGIAGSYDADNGLLTVVTYTQPTGDADYVNSTWEQQEKPYEGDAINSYNDGPLGPDKGPLGPFYELETSSPALALKPGESYEHVHRTIHLVGDEKALDPVARKVFGVGLEEIRAAMP